MNELGTKLARARTRAGLSLRDIQARSGFNSGYLSQVERGLVKEPTISALRKLAVAYDVPERAVFAWIGVPCASFNPTDGYCLCGAPLGHPDDDWVCARCLMERERDDALAKLSRLESKSPARPEGADSP